MKTLTTPFIAASLLAALALPAQAQIVNIDATVTGCDFNHCHGMHLSAGNTVDAVISPAQLTLGPGTYTLTNAAGLPGAQAGFDAWRFDGGPDWVWAFMVIDDSTRKILLQACCGAQVYSTQAAAAADPFAQSFSASLTLPTTTKLDFVTEDWFPSDNAAGVAIAVTSAVPEPASWLLTAAGLLALVVGRRRLGRPHS